MGLASWWLKWRRQRREPVVFESRWTIAVEGDRITVIDSQGAERHVALSDLKGVAIETNDSGPWGADVWWLLFDGGGSRAAMWPQGAVGEQAAIDRLMALPGFAMEEMIRAMASTDNSVFPVWQRPD